MPFNAIGFALASAMTRDMEDRARAAQISMLGGLLGGNLAGVALLAVAASGGRAGTTPLPPGTDTGVPGRVQVPELPDDREDAEEVLRRHGLVPVVVAVESTEPLDGVIGSNPPAETVVRRGSTVEVHVSAGVPVPDVVGKDADAAEEALTAAGFESRRCESEKSGREGIVEHQDPKGGEFVDARTVVDIYVFPAKPTLRAAEDKEK
jgi:hypothetical protein